MISVIVPVYNAERYLDNCISSILSQTYKDFELILVDDGSNDGSELICEKYARNDHRVRVLHQENRGPSDARNNASVLARGEYITFIDSDDYVTCDYLEKLESTRRKYNADISAVLMAVVGEEFKEIAADKEENIIELTGEEALLDVLYQKHLDTTPCGMLFEKKIVLENPFPVGRYHEDDFTMYKYFEQSSKVLIIHEVKYYYIQRSTSIMHTISPKILRDEIDASENLVRYFSNSDEKLLNAARSKKFSNFCQILIRYPGLRKDQPLIYSEVTSFLRDEKFRILFNNETRLKNKFAAFILLFGPESLKKVGKLISHR